MFVPVAQKTNWSQLIPVSTSIYDKPVENKMDWAGILEEDDLDSQQQMDRFEKNCNWRFWIVLSILYSYFKIARIESSCESADLSW